MDIKQLTGRCSIPEVEEANGAPGWNLEGGLFQKNLPFTGESYRSCRVVREAELIRC